MNPKMILFIIIYTFNQIITNGEMANKKIIKLTIFIYMKIRDLNKQKIMAFIQLEPKIKLMILKINGENMNLKWMN